MSIFGKIREYRLKSLIDDQKEFYSRSWSPREMRRWQLGQFNKQWQKIRRDVPYFARLFHERGLPERFRSWAQFREQMPVIDRSTVQEHRGALTNTSRSPDFHRVTGGSTAEPVKIPAWSTEKKYEQKNLWYARDWYEITPSDRLFLLWGHSHIFGEGLRGWWNKTKRRLKDRLLGYHRANAYNLSKSALRRAGRKLLQFKPDYVYGYSQALDQLAQANEDRANEFRQLGLKAVIATAESFPRPDSPELLKEVFGAPVTMEYGAVEMGALAHLAPDGDFQIFWRHFKIDGEQTDLLDGAYEIYVTSLYPRCFPLVRYRIGDVVPEDPTDPSFDQRLSSIIGRCNDYLVLTSGRRIHSEAFTHAIKDLSHVQAYQVHQKDVGKIEFYYVERDGNAMDAGNKEEIIRKRLGRIDDELTSIEVLKVDNLTQTPAGKSKRVVRE
jgi:phenylacetate-coenzyme A ligase PaaK-like adenylate-forming protein